jgi:dienelactone hydrolase
MAQPQQITLSTGAVVRITGSGERSVVCVNGGSGRERPGDWSATLEWLVGRLSPRHSDLAFVEVRYRVKSWRQLDSCIEDCVGALETAAARGTREIALLGFSMGGAVAIASAAHPAVSTVLCLAPWIPDRLDVAGLRGRRMAVIHGSFDGRLPGLPGVNPKRTLRGLERVRSLGVEVTQTLIRGGVHGVAVHSPFGGLLPLPRAGSWERLVDLEFARFATA